MQENHSNHLQPNWFQTAVQIPIRIVSVLIDVSLQAFNSSEILKKNDVPTSGPNVRTYSSSSNRNVWDEFKTKEALWRTLLKIVTARKFHGFLHSTATSMSGLLQYFYQWGVHLQNTSTCLAEQFRHSQAKLQYPHKPGFWTLAKPGGMRLDGRPSRTMSCAKRGSASHADR